MNTPSKEDLDNLFRPMYEEYFEKRSSKVSINFAAQQLHNNENSSLTSSIIIEEQKAPPIVTTSEEQTSPNSLSNDDEFNQEDSANFDGNAVFVPYDSPNFEEAESLKIALDPSNMHEFHQETLNTYLDKSLSFGARLQVHQSPRGIFISQSQYAIELLKKHGMDDCVSMSTSMATEILDPDLQGTPTDQTTYRRMIGGLMYLTASRPDIAFATYADHAGYKDDCKSTSRGLLFIGEKLMSWSSKKQDCTAMSTAEAEYVSLSSAIAISCNPVQQSRTTHINIRYHFIKEHVEKEPMELYFVRTENQLADLFTKALPKERFEYIVHRI
nr:copia protein [Tanacetum cinerariifolium]